MLPQELDLKITEKEISVKNPLVSKTVIANVLLLAISFLTIVSPETLGVDPKVLLMISAFLNIALRFVTSERIAFGANSENKVEIKVEEAK